MTPSPSSSPSRMSPQANHQVTGQAFFQPVIRAQENLIFAIKNIHEDEFDRYFDQALLDGASLNSVDEHGFYPLELAVIERRPRIVESLLARGAPLPVVAEDGFDLVMLAASNGHSTMLAVLIDSGSMMSDAQDSQGLTPLHYAVMHGHLQAAITLIDREADIDKFTTDVLDAQICSDTGIPPSLAGSGCTPLMLAVSTGNLAMVDLLLSHYADVDVGAIHPLEIAVIKNDVAMIGLLIHKGIDPNRVVTTHGQSLLSLAIENQCSLLCIKKLLPPGTLLRDHSDTTHSPLRIATRTGQHEIAAYLLCQGAQAEFVDEPLQTTWEFASNLPDQGKMTQILVAARSDYAVKLFIQSNEDLINLYHMARHPVALAVRGFFLELLTPLVAALHPKQNLLHQLTPAQQELEIAFSLMRINTPETAVTSSPETFFAGIIAGSPERQFIQSIPEKINTQKKEIYEWSKYLVDKKMVKISTYFSRHFLVSMTADCPKGTQLSTFMMRRLREKEGFPDNLSEIIVSAWTAAEKNVNGWHLPGANAGRISQCKEYYAMNRMESELLRQIHSHQEDANASSFSNDFSYKALGQCTWPVNHFAQNPVSFLQLLEESIEKPSLNDAQLEVAFCLATGLTPVKSRAIVAAWRTTRQAAERRFPPSEIERRHHFSCEIMASALKSLLPPQHYPDGTLEPMLLRWQTQLHHWCDVALAANHRDARVINRF